MFLLKIDYLTELLLDEVDEDSPEMAEFLAAAKAGIEAANDAYSNIMARLYGDDEDESGEWEESDDDLERGFDPYAGCYTYDC